MPGDRQAAHRRRDGLAECAESVRTAKMKQKVSGCPRSLTGAGQFCAIRSYLPAAAKHGVLFFTALVMLTKAGHGCPGRRRHAQLTDT
jgi:hypothetical protein